MAETSNQASSGEATTLAPRSSHRLGFVALALLLLACGVLWMFARPAKRAYTSNPGSGTTILPLDSFTVNLADAEEGRFLRVTMSLGVDGLLPAATKADSQKPESRLVSMATIRDSILTVLAQCKSDELLTPEGKTKLKQELLSALNRDVAPLGAREVYFTEFLVQR